ncbi:ATP-binding protein [Mycoplasma phocoeninasale]|uniref:ATP-binding protein n=1 Tax=Mycoplasma phocoeninasale TaxID=2726117 RepID=UPI0019675086|nr:ATP-binding protein [Mycoplasma phocoeninasale]MBN0970499.1 AAA family ATPase [Mycoplasma phocoeninasale]
MRKRNILNLIKYHYEKDEIAFNGEVIEVAKYFDSIGDDELANYVLSLRGISAEDLVAQSNNKDFEINSEFLERITIDKIEDLHLPASIIDDIKGIINAIDHKSGINKFLFQGPPGTGKTEAAKNVARILKRSLYSVNFESLVDSKLGQTNKNIINLFDEINAIPFPDRIVILFDEMDAIALDRINSNDIREMGRVTSTVLKELDKLFSHNKDIVIIATTNLFSSFDKALIRRFDATINFDRYTQEDLIDVAKYYLEAIIKKFEGASLDVRVFKKILKLVKKLPYPGELKNIIKTSLAFSEKGSKFGYLIRIYNSLVGGLDNKKYDEIHKEGFTVREIEILKEKSKSSVAREIKKELDNNE